MHRVLVINPGSTSTKVALYEGDVLVFTESRRLSSEELGLFPHILDQYDSRLDTLLEVARERTVDMSGLAGVVARGGLLRPIPSGTYSVNEKMVAELSRRDKVREHASNLGALLAYDIAKRVGVPAFVVDPVCVDEFHELARISGLPEIERRSLSHALNIKAVARRAALDLGRPYGDLHLVVVHLGGGISVTAHRRGRMVDVNQALDGTGPFAPERSGGLPVGDVVRMCFGIDPYADYKLTYDEMFRRIAGQGGLVAHLGTNSAVEVENRIMNGDDRARLVYEAMAYQIAKEIGAMATVLEGVVDAIAVTGGVAHSEVLLKWIRERVGWIAPILVYAGENEMLALAQGALRVLRGEERALVY
jgi:butyrate kinase